MELAEIVMNPVRQRTLLLTDEEFSGFLTEINQIAVKYMKKEAVEGSRMRQITFISAPSNE